jgi:hypothetical protein
LSPTETTKPVSGASTKEAVKTIRAGNAGRFRRTCGDDLRVFSRKLRVRDAPGIPCAL